ncbi:MAG: hypothetical protein GWP19_00235 [Planctomycetia bacterium]|nr:hypothetical protein [Planctomycetia bacterium]
MFDTNKFLSSSEITKRFTDDYFRMMIFGSTGCGKSYWLTKTFFPIIMPKYDVVIVFTKEHNRIYYRNALEPFKKQFKLKTSIVTKDIPGNLKKIVAAQDRNKMKKHSKDGEILYKDNILLIYDDILDERLFKDRKFLDQFTSLRHQQFSVIVISQTINKEINTQMKANTQFFVIFKLNHYKQSAELIKIIEGCVGGINESEDYVKKKARSLYTNRCCTTKYGNLIVTDDSFMF